MSDPGLQAELGHSGVAVLVWGWEPASDALVEGAGSEQRVPPLRLLPSPRLRHRTAVRAAACQGMHPAPRFVA